jgi:hypothetical protein
LHLQLKNDKLEFTNVRQPIKVIFTNKSYTQEQFDATDYAGEISIQYQMEGDTELLPKEDKIFLNANYVPVKGLSSGVECEIVWNGFEEVF